MDREGDGKGGQLTKQQEPLDYSSEERYEIINFYIRGRWKHVLYALYGDQVHITDYCIIIWKNDKLYNFCHLFYLHIIFFIV